MNEIDLSNLAPAYQCRLEWIDKEEAAARERGARMIVQLLDECRQVTVACVGSAVAAFEESVAMSSYFEAMCNDIAARRKANAERLSAINVSGELPPLLRQLAIEEVKTSELRLNMAINMNSMVTHTVEFMLLGLETLFATQDNAPTTAFLEGIKGGLLDALLGTVPGVDLLLVGVRAIEAAVKARANERNSANNYVVSIETYVQACRLWKNGMDGFVAGLEEMRNRPSPAAND